jgi:hypothetical protein
VSQMSDAAARIALQVAADRLGDAQSLQNATLKQAYPVNSYVRWKAGPYIQSGTVQQHNYDASLFAINTNTGKRVRVHEYAIREALKDA